MRRLRAALLALALSCGSLLLADRLYPLPLDRLASVGTEVVDREGRTVALLPAPGGVWRFRTSADEVPRQFLDLLVTVEDRRFWYHPGVDPVALVRATVQWLRAGRVVSGGSTLTMQAARLLEPRPRTLRSKIIEALRALQLEAHYSKREILGIWLSLAPFGGNLEGVRAASFAWFGARPQSLDPAQQALLVAFPRRPEALRPDRHPEPARLLRDRVLAQGVRAGLFAAAAPVALPLGRRALPLHAPQVLATVPRAPVVATTLDLPLQAALERLAAERLVELPPRASLALLIGDLRTREIRALTAGDWGNEARAGAVDLTRAVRSPGSALKPFIYAMALEDGIAGPQTRLVDLPRRFGGYAPEDFDRGFAGSVTFAEALRRSLNLPAVALLDRIGPLRYAETLRAAGVPLALPAGAEASLPLALGGGGISLRDAATLYTALAGDGSATRLRLLAAEPVMRRPFLEARAARTIAGPLTTPFPDGGPPGVAWKTGTSWGGRDAWALGFDAAHVAGVWVGRPDGTPLPGATGTALALPILAHLFDLLPPAPRPEPTIEQEAAAAPAAADALRLLFPPDAATLSADGPVTLRAMGGRRPLAFLVDGVRVPAEPVRRTAEWSPPGPGFYRLTVLDADGAAAHAGVRIK